MYTSKKSAKLTMLLTCIFCVLLLIIMVMARPALIWFFGGKRMDIIKTILTAFYICCPAAWIALGGIMGLLVNIIKEKIFITRNVTYMRVLSWCCAFVSIVCLIFGFMYVPFFIVALSAGFMTLILRVLKNVMARATEIQNENDLTI